MKAYLKIGLVVGLSLLAAACGLNVPDPGAISQNCSSIELPANPGDNRFFFWSTRIPDCRKGYIAFTGFRDESTRFGRSVADGPSGRLGSKSRSAFTAAEDVWLADIQKRVNEDPSHGLVVYVHGFNNDFGDEFERAFELARLTPGNPPIVIYDWPSRNRVTRYSVDANSAFWSQDDFNALLMKLTKISSNITVVSHSMGNRIAIGGVRYLGLARDAAPSHIKRMILASPDFDRASAQNHALRELAIYDRKIVVYASRHDRPIGVSTGIHGYALLGSSRCRYDINYARSRRKPGNDCHLAPVYPGLSVVDTSDVAARGVLNHTDFISSCEVRTDLKGFLADVPPSDMMWRKSQRDGDRQGYRIDKAYFNSRRTGSDCQTDRR